MANPKDETGKGPPRPGDPAAGKRPYATLDLQATEVGGAGKAADADRPGADAKPAAESTRPSFTDSARAAAARAATLAGRVRSGPLLSNLGAGALGALIVLLGGYLLLFPHAPSSVPGAARDLDDVRQRLTDAEAAIGLRPGDRANLRGKVEDLDRSLRGLSEAQSQLAANTKALESKIGSAGAQGVPPDIVQRLARLEQGATNQTGGDPSEAVKAVTAKVDRDLASVRTEAGRLSARIDALKAEVDERMKTAAKSADMAQLQARLAALDSEFQSLVKTEADRTANSARVLVSLELASLKRVMDRGEPYTAELAAVKKAAGDKLDVKPLERYMREGVPTAADITKSFRKVSNAVLDAEAEPADATLVDRLLSGARSIVRVRKAGHSPDDTSVEATVARMEAALKEQRLAEVLEQGKKLPPKAELAAEDWLKQVEARQSVDKAMADIEAKLKSSLADNRPKSEEPRR